MKCPLCNNEVSTIITEELRQGKGIVYLCDKCDLGMLDEVYTEDFYKEEYRKEYGPKLKGTEPEEEFTIMSRCIEDKINLVKTNLIYGSLLDIGCSAGQFLSQISKYVKKAEGIELNTKFAKYGNKRIHGFVYNDYDNLLASVRTYGGYDNIVSFQTLEHVDNPIQFMNTIKQLSHINSKIIIEVPNLDDAMLTLYDCPKYKKIMFHKAHKWYFTKKSLLKLMDICGFKGNILFTQDYGMFNHMYWNLYNHGQESIDLGMSHLKNIRTFYDEDDLVHFLDSTERKYKTILADKEKTSNITFIGGWK